MKENTNIEDLFKDKFDNFEANVDPSVWANVSQSINAGSAGAGSAATGLSGIAKVAIIAAAVTATTVGVWYFTKDSNKDQISDQEETVTPNNNENDVATVSIIEENIQVGDTNDPVIQENMEEIQEEFSTVEISTENFDEELIDILLESQTQNNSSPIITEEDNSSNESSNSDDNAEETNNSGDQDIVDEQPEVVQKKVKVNLDYQMNENELVFSSGAKNHFQTEWTFGDGKTSTKDNGSHIYEKPGTYDVMLTVMGESGTTVYEFRVEVEGTSSVGQISNVFTPNNDGVNDRFFIESTDIEEFTIVIYDMKDGQEVFRSEDPEFEWNGERPDGTVVSGSYLYKVVAVGNDGAIHKKGGRITIEK